MALGAHHPKLKRVRALLRDAKERRRESAVVAEGPRVLATLLDGGRGVPRELFVTPDAANRWMSLVERAEAAGAQVFAVDIAVLERVGDTRTTQGIVCVADAPRACLDDVVHALAAHPAAFTLVVDEVGDPGNAGTIVRSAEAFGARAIVLGPGSVDAYNPKAVRASAGTCFAVPIVEASVEQVTTADVLEVLGAHGVRRLGADAAASTGLADALRGEPTLVAVVLGHETRGLPPDLPLDARFSIPMRGVAESLNVAMAATVCAYEVARSMSE
jgi:RNA methyltransferase, TrmH family